MNKTIKQSLTIFNRQLSITMLLFATLLSSCQKTDLTEVATEGPQRVTLNLVADDAVGTRAAATGVSNYLIEVYSDATYTTPANIFGTGNNATNRSVSTNGSFSMILDRTVDYYCLFWADRDASVYTTTMLKSVTLKSGKAPAEAWFGKAAISGKNATQTVTLNRAVAKLNLLEIGAIVSGTTLTTTFNQPTVFNVSNGEIVSGTNDANIVSRTETITLTNAVSGTKESPVTLNSADYFILTPTATQYVVAVTFQCGNEDAFEVSNVPFQANYKTNIKGHYTSLAAETFTVTCDDAWGNPDNDESTEIRYAVGDLYPNAVSPAGIVAYVDPTHESYNASTKKGTKLLLMSFEESQSYSYNIADLELPTTGGLKWQIPTIYDWQRMYGAMSGLNVTYTETTPYVNGAEWRIRALMPSFGTTGTQRADFNNKFTLANKPALDYSEGPSSGYWSSTKGEYQYKITLSTGIYDGSASGVNSYRVRFISKVNYKDYAVGDYYPNPTDAASAIGVVFYVNPVEPTSGYIVSLDETTAAWSTVTEETGANSYVNGTDNMTAIKSMQNWKTNYPAFAWCDAKNTPAVEGISWFLPATGDLRALVDQKKAVNAALAAASESQLSGVYWSSKEDFEQTADSYDFIDESFIYPDKNSQRKVRAISFFNNPQ